MTFIPGSGSSSNSLNATVSSLNVPAGGKFITIENSLGKTSNSSNLSTTQTEDTSPLYVVPAGCIFIATTAGLTDNSSIKGTIYCRSKAVTTVSGASSAAIYLVFKENEVITVGAYVYGSTSSFDASYISGYEVQVSNSLSVSSYFNSSYSPDWKTGVVIDSPKSSQEPVRAVWLGDGKALLIRNAILDKTTTIVDIDSGQETPIYTGSVSFSLTDRYYLHAAYQANYKSSGKSLVRIATGGPEPKDKALEMGDNGTTGYLLDIYSGSSDSDFKVRNLENVVFGNLSKGIFLTNSLNNLKKVLGFAGIDYLVTLKFDAKSSSSYYYYNTFYNYAVETYKIDQTQASVNTLIPSSSIFGSTNENQKSTYWQVGVTSVRGKDGRLYISLHGSYYYKPTTGTGIGYVAVIALSNTGTVIHNLSTTNIYSLANSSTLPNSFSIDLPMSFGVTNEASERALQVSLGSYSTNRVQLHYSINSSGVPSPALLTSHTVTGFSTTPSPVTASTLGSYNTGPYTSGVGSTSSGDYSTYPNSYYTGAAQFMHHPQRARLTNGCFFGNSAGWYIPTGLFVEKRSRTDFSNLVGDGVVPTTIANPVQAFAGQTKVLVVGVDGSWEIVTP